MTSFFFRLANGNKYDVKAFERKNRKRTFVKLEGRIALSEGVKSVGGLWSIMRENQTSAMRWKGDRATGDSTSVNILWSIYVKV